MAKISFAQKEIDGNPVSGVELDRFVIQGDSTALVAEDLLKFDLNGEASGVSGINGQILKIVAGAPAFLNFSADENLAANGHVVLDNGLILNWQTTTALAALASITLTHSKPFSSLNLGSFVSVTDLNNVLVQATTETLLDITLKNFDAVNAAGTVRVFSLGI